jgi:1-acyl-sn-glycerol-3-phosphate acyltransferase
VLKDLLQFDPCIDTVLNRLPNRFIQPNPPPGGGAIDSIAELAAGLEADGALILFPEGGNFSAARRTRAIERLREEGLHELVPLAEELTEVLPPRPGGALAAISAAPGADVLFVAHTGLEQISSARDVWRELPMRDEVRLTWWRVPAAEVPTGRQARIAWLYEWWERIDTWIEDHHEPGVPSSPLPRPGDGSDDG